MHKFNNTQVRTPTEFTWDTKTVEAGSPTADGKDHSVILSEKRILSYTWSDPTKEEVSQILALVKETRYTNIEYPDAETGTDVTGEFRITKNSAPFRSLRVGQKIYSKLSLSFEER